MDKKIINGSEGVLIYKDSIILGMQKEKRWYDYNNRKAALIKTIGGSVEEDDENSTLLAVNRELKEELSIEDIDYCINIKPIFYKKVNMNDLNPFESKTNLEFNAFFYLIKINDKIDIIPNDLPYLFIIPISEFIKMKMSRVYETKKIIKYAVGNDIDNIPSYFSFFIPNELVDFLRGYNNEK